MRSNLMGTAHFAYSKEVLFSFCLLSTLEIVEFKFF